MSVHVFGAVVTAPGVAANNRGENEGNITTLQKLLWRDQVHTTVSSEAIRWAIRYYWQMKGEAVNRQWLDEKEDHIWADAKYDGNTYIDDDALGYMKAEGGKTEGEKGSAQKRRGVLEIARAVSLTPYSGDITFNARSGVKDRTSLYGTEVHATRYQYGFAFTPERLCVSDRALLVLDAIANLGEVAGNHSRFLFDFSPDSIVLRLTDDPAPRLLYCFEAHGNGHVDAPELVRRVQAGDIGPSELYVGGPISEIAALSQLDAVQRFSGVKSCIVAFKNALSRRLAVVEPAS